MSSGKHFVYAWITYILMSYGVINFYYDVRSGHFRKSRVMRIYCRIVFSTLFCALAWVVVVYWNSAPKIPTRSKLMTVLLCSQPLIFFLSFVTCIVCSQFKQQSIFELFRDLLRMNNLIDESHFCGTPLKRSLLLKLYWIRLLLTIFRTALLLTRIFSERKNFIFHFSITGSRVVMCGFFFMQFHIVWHIWYAFLRLQIYLEFKQFNQPMPMNRRVQKVLEVHRMYYKLIQMINKFSDIFKYSLAFSLMQLICNACLNGYYFIRKLLGRIQIPLSRSTEAFLIMLNLVNVSELLIFANMANMACKLHDETLHILRSSNSVSKQLERSNDWLALQLTWQNKKINIFGVLNFDHKLIFIVLTSAVLHIIYIVQSDYRYFQI